MQASIFEERNECHRSIPNAILYVSPFHLLSSTKYHDKCSPLNILDIFAYYVHSAYLQTSRVLCTYL